MGGARRHEAVVGVVSRPDAMPLWPSRRHGPRSRRPSSRGGRQSSRGAGAAARDAGTRSAHRTRPVQDIQTRTVRDRHVVTADTRSVRSFTDTSGGVRKGLSGSFVEVQGRDQPVPAARSQGRRRQTPSRPIDACRPRGGSSALHAPIRSASATGGHGRGMNTPMTRVTGMGPGRQVTAPS